MRFSRFEPMRVMEDWSKARYLGFVGMCTDREELEALSARYFPLGKPIEYRGELEEPKRW
jgi:hypothetical protein